MYIISHVDEIANRILFFAEINFSQIMWVLVLTARRQLQWEFSNVFVVRKTTSTIGSQR